MRYWLFKTEPSVYSIDHLKKEKSQIEHWDGVRNYQARNFMRDDMKVGDKGFFYHSNCKEVGIVGIVKIVKEAYPDFTAFDEKEKYYDPKSDPENPRWFMVDVKYIRKLKRTITLDSLKNNPALADMALVKRGNRLSIMPVTKEEWNEILAMEKG